MDDVAGGMGNKFFGTNVLEVGSLQVVHLCRSTKSDVACDLGRKRPSHGLGGSKHTPWRQAPFSRCGSLPLRLFRRCDPRSLSPSHSLSSSPLSLSLSLSLLLSLSPPARAQIGYVAAFSALRGVRQQQATAAAAAAAAAASWRRGSVELFYR